MRLLIRLAVMALPLLVAIPAGARIVQQGQPPAAESGGHPVPAAGPARAPGCAAPAPELVCALAAPFALGAFAWWVQAEEMVRVTAASRLQLAVERATWRAPRLAARRAAIERKRLSHRD